MSSTRTTEGGFTLIELIAVVALMGLLSVAVLTKFDFLSSFRQREQYTTFVNVWELLFRESIAKGQSYRLIIDLDNQTYQALREVSGERPAVQQVDNLKNLRTRSEQAKRAAPMVISEDEERTLQEQQRGRPLDEQFADFRYADPYGNLRLGKLTESPQLSEPTKLPDGLKFRGVKLRSEIKETGQAVIRFSPRGGSEFAVVYLQVGEDIFTISCNPTTGEIFVRAGEIALDWAVSRPGSRVTQ